MSLLITLNRSDPLNEVLWNSQWLFHHYSINKWTPVKGF